MARHDNSKKMKQPRTNVGASPTPDEAINRGDKREQQEHSHEELVKAVTPKDSHKKDKDRKDSKKKR